jgi:hypothetical protein
MLGSERGAARAERRGPSLPQSGSPTRGRRLKLPAHSPHIRPRSATPLAVVRDEQSFVRAPIGRCFVSTSFLVWRFARDLGGLAFWGHPTVDDARFSRVCLRHVMQVGSVTSQRSPTSGDLPESIQRPSRSWCSGCETARQKTKRASVARSSFWTRRRRARRSRV